MKFLMSVLVTALCAAYFASVSCPDDWKEMKGEHFVVYFTQDSEFSKNVLDKAEGYYKDIATGLGYPRYSEFWIWEKRVKIYIHPDHNSFLKASHQPEWSQGMADYTNKQIISFAWSQGFVESLLPHEIAHLIFRDFVGFKGEVRLWLDEGVAQWAEENRRQASRKMIKKAYDDDMLLTFDDMMNLNIMKITEKGGTYIRPTVTRSGDRVTMILGGENLVSLYYLEAVSMVDFLIEKYGSKDFAGFCRELRDGKRLESALRFVYSNRLDTIEEFENRWRKYVSQL
jgi:hypothetical protein